MAYPHSDHYDGDRFHNPGVPQAKGLLDVLRWKLTTRPARWAASTEHSTPVVPASRVDGAFLRLTLINHSSVLFQYGGQNVLTDPIWSDRASPVSWLGPRRYAQPGVRLEDLPPIHVILLSHNHYDHLDIATLKQISAAHRPRIMVPLGVGRLLKKHGMHADLEMDWWQTDDAITCVPARHFSARGPTDRNRTLWCGYWLKTPSGGVYFAADTAIGSHFADIRDRLGRPRLALLPIAAYKPEWFMEPVHMSPAQAVEAHRILEAQESVAIHWGTFRLADDAPEEALDDLKRALTKYPDAAPFQVIRNGGVIEISGRDMSG